MKKFDGIAQAVSAILIAGACLGAGSWLGDREDDLLLALRGGDLGKRALRIKDCGDFNLVDDEVGWLNCPREGEICVQCRWSLMPTYEVSSSPTLETPGINFTGMVSCAGDKAIGFCNNTVEYGLICDFPSMPPITGVCTGEIEHGVYQEQTPPGSGD